ncbi:MAG: ATP-binding cassette domain-containing protein, partial [Lactobacillus delbrueckii]
LQSEKGQIIFKDAAGQAFQPDPYSIGYQAQDLVLFPATLAENVTMHTPGLSADPKDCLKTVGLQLDPQRQITPDDLTLSGGQKQKLALARTLSHGFPLLLLDESLSAVDRAGQDQILRTLCQLPATVIFVAHNLSPEQKARFDRKISLAKKEHV